MCVFSSHSYIYTEFSGSILYLVKLQHMLIARILANFERLYKMFTYTVKRVEVSKSSKVAHLLKKCRPSTYK